ncbi:hypothetical protein AAG570_000465 [Ranatra chinensis]|uniref:CHK kinase-like domain-containing protein n=1 Tax=Ranatra chinensis TaxID=642074 RepID=A0ABD0YX55_9HEMI
MVLDQGVLTEIASEGFGSGFRLVRFESRKEGKSAFQFASCFDKGTLTLDVDVVVKRQPLAPYRRELMMSDRQFHNEVVMYKELLPFIGASHFAPTMYYGVATGGEAPERDIVVLSYLAEYSVHRCGPVYLDLDHLKFVLARLGHFHALSYNAKGRGLRVSSAKLQPVGMSDRNMDEHEFWLRDALMRGIKPLLSLPEYKAVLEKLIEKMGNMSALVNYLESHEEPTALLCHGDFCSNNIVFKYNDRGVIEDVKFVDFQASNYASPAMDLSFFLLLNTSAELRAASWDDLLETYLHSLFENLTKASVAPTREQILEEFSKRALYGYLHCSFFLPVMLTGRSNDDEWDGSEAKELGGEECTESIAHIMRFLLDRGYIDAFLQNFTDKLL